LAASPADPFPVSLADKFDTLEKPAISCPEAGPISACRLLASAGKIMQ
jgi:hypothetical protein